MSMTRRTALIAAAATSCLLSVTAAVAETAPFTKAAFEAAQKAGKPILVDVTASWCPTCKAQAPILSSLQQAPAFKNLFRFNVDFDTQKDVLAAFRVQTQSTLIVFKGNTEVGRSVGDTNKTSIEALLQKSL